MPAARPSLKTSNRVQRFRTGMLQGLSPTWLLSRGLCAEWMFSLPIEGQHALRGRYTTLAKKARTTDRIPRGSQHGFGSWRGYLTCVCGRKFENLQLRFSVEVVTFLAKKVRMADVKTEGSKNGMDGGQDVCNFWEMPGR